MSSIDDPPQTASPMSPADLQDNSNIIMSSFSTPSESSSSTSYPSSALIVSRRKSSPIWQYCRKEEGKTAPAAWVDSHGKKWWHCKPCFDKKREKKYNYSGGSSTITEHLYKEHRISISTGEEVRRM